MKYPLTTLLLLVPLSTAFAQSLLPRDWSPKQAADRVLAGLIRVTAPNVKGAHDAEMVIVNDRAFIVAEVNDERPGEGASWPCMFGRQEPLGATANALPNKLPGKDALKMTETQASSFARLALKAVQQEYPNKPEHVLNSATDVCGPRALHPAFYGSFDWHSSVHGHWMLVRLLRLFPDLPERQQIRQVLDEHLTAGNLQTEADYFTQPNRQSFERTYGWAWFLKLAEELHGWDDPDGRRWSGNLRPLTDTIAARYLAYIPKQTYPIRTGVHPNTAFGLSFAFDYARAVGHKPLQDLVEERSRTYFAKDAAIPAAWEPGGTDFFSPSLMEADLMRRVLSPKEFQTWLRRFLPGLENGEPKTLFVPAQVTDRSDPQLVHLDGLNLSRAWCMREIAAALPKDDPSRKALADSAARHVDAALPHVASGNYMGEHWLATFAVYLLSWQTQPEEVNHAMPAADNRDRPLSMAKHDRRELPPVLYKQCLGGPGSGRAHHAQCRLSTLRL